MIRLRNARRRVRGTRRISKVQRYGRASGSRSNQRRQRINDVTLARMFDALNDMDADNDHGERGIFQIHPTFTPSWKTQPIVTQTFTVDEEQPVPGVLESTEDMLTEKVDAEIRRRRAEHYDDGVREISWEPAPDQHASFMVREGEPTEPTDDTSPHAAIHHILTVDGKSDEAES